MKKFVTIAIVLCSCATACSRKDTGVGEMWARTVEPRLPGAIWQPCYQTPLSPDRIVANVRCGSTAAPDPNERCDLLETSRAEAVRMLALKPGCTDEALAALETHAREDPAVWSDVAAAYYIRAQREDQASDFLAAFDAAGRAVAARPADATARFNLAMVQEAIGLKEQAIASWRAVEDDGSEWAGEARERGERLQRELAQAPSAQWERNRAALPAAVRAGDAAAIARLIKPFPRGAMRYLLETMLPNGDPADLYAQQLAARLNGDRYAIDVAAAAPRNRSGHLLLREGRRQLEALLHEKAAASYAKAGALLRQGGSPGHFEADLGRVAALVGAKQFARAAEILDPIEREARDRSYLYLVAGMRAFRAHILFRQSRYVESMAEYDATIEPFERFRDEESIANIHRSQAGNYSFLGHHDLAWSEAMQALRYIPRTTDITVKHTILGEAAKAALNLGNAPAALRLQDLAVDVVHKELMAVPPERVEEVQRVLQWQLAVALRERARIELALGDYATARRDLDEAIRLKETNEEKGARRLLEAGMKEIEGRVLMEISPARAADAFTAAIGHVEANELRTLRASYYTQRGAALLKMGRTADAERDLQAALSELRAEENQMLAGRQLGEGENVWSTYFARFDETYEQLIRLLVEQNREGEAFAHSERARAFEPLNLVLQLPFLPREFRELTRGGNPIARDAIQRSLPHGTFLLHYTVTADRTYTWVISRGAVRLVQREVEREDVARWTAALQRAGRRRDEHAFNDGVYAPYHALLEKPLEAIAAMNGGRPPARLVFIPDEAMHGLPFAALRASNQHPHLVRNSIIEIAGSATLYLFSLLRDRDLASPHPSALLIGDPAFNQGLALARKLPRLPAAGAEVEEIRPMYEPRVAVRVGEDATFPEFLAHARDKTIVHFAGHSIVDPQEPSRSLLLLAPSPRRTGAVEARELLTNLKLDQTRLVVLAACSSAGGLPVGPEGVAPLVRPLVGAGVPAVIGSLWDVDDATAKAVFVSFHRHYRQGSDAAAALRAAQVELLDNKKAGLESVLSWAPFQVIGHASSPFATPAKKVEEHLGIRRQNPVLGNARADP